MVHGPFIPEENHSKNGRNGIGTPHEVISKLDTNDPHFFYELDKPFLSRLDLIARIVDTGSLFIAERYNSVATARFESTLFWGSFSLFLEEINRSNSCFQSHAEILSDIKNKFKILKECEDEGYEGCTKAWAKGGEKGATVHRSGMVLLTSADIAKYHSNKELKEIFVKGAAEAALGVDYQQLLGTQVGQKETY